MDYIVNFFEFVLKKDHTQNDNDLYKLRKKLDQLDEDLGNQRLISEERVKKEAAKEKAIKGLVEARKSAISTHIPAWLEYFSKQKISNKPFHRSTHLSKFENAANDYGSINSDQYLSKSMNFISTSSIPNKTYDIAHSNGNQINLSKFLLVEDRNKKTVFEKIWNDDISWLEEFFSDNKKRLEIASDIKSLISMSPDSPDSAQHKQIYFPVSEENIGYHIVSPLFSSSFSQFLYDKVRDTKGKQAVKRKAKKDGKYEKGILCTFPDIGLIRMGGDKPNNISPLNSMRFGESVLLSCQPPPQWKTQTKPPVRRRTIFNSELSRTVKEPVEQLQKLLLAIKSNNLSMNLERKKLIASLVTEIAYSVFDYAAQIQKLKHLAGWSQESNLVAHQQYWLDPFRQDELFQTARTDLDWQANIRMDFARWVNRQLKHQQLTLGIAQESYWETLFKPLLREFSALLGTHRLSAVKTHNLSGLCQLLRRVVYEADRSVTGDTTDEI